MMNPFHRYAVPLPLRGRLIIVPLIVQLYKTDA